MLSTVSPQFRRSNSILLLNAPPILQALKNISHNLQYHQLSILSQVVLPHHLLIPSELVTNKIKTLNTLVFILIGVQLDNSHNLPISPIGAQLFLILPTVAQTLQAQLHPSTLHPASVNVQIVIKVLIALIIIYLLQILVLVAHPETLLHLLLRHRVLRLTNRHFVLITEVLLLLQLQRPPLYVLQP
jgi:hypothetical protein